MDVQTFLKETIEKVTSHPLIHVETGATIVEHSGFKGNFKTGISVGPDKTRETIEHGIIIVATGGDEFKPVGKYTLWRRQTRHDPDGIREGFYGKHAACI